MSARKMCYCLIILLFVAQSRANILFKESRPSEGPSHVGNISYTLISASNHTYGYDIIINGRTTIHQATIPGMSGKDGFKTKENAIKIAQLVISKIKRGEMPPTITISEMEKLRILLK